MAMGNNHSYTYIHNMYKKTSVSYFFHAYTLQLHLIQTPSTCRDLCCTASESMQKNVDGKQEKAVAYHKGEGKTQMTP